MKRERELGLDRRETG